MLDKLKEKHSPVFGEIEPNHFDNYSIIWLNEVPSTMGIVDGNIKKNILNKIVVANFQNNGQGRFGRSWVSPKGKNLLVSIPFKIQHEFLKEIPVISSLAVFKTIKYFLKDNDQINIKWPNDILINGKKISGIILHTKTNYKESIVNLGVGINVNTTLKDLKSIELPATSLKIENKSSTNIETVLYRLIKDVSHNLNRPYYKCFQEWKDNLIIPDKNLIVKDVFQGTEEMKCKPLGVNNDGLLLVQTPEGVSMSLTAEEVSFQG